MSTKLIRKLLVGLLALIILFIAGRANAEAELVEENKDMEKKLISSKIPMDIAHQDYLYRMCEKRDLDYVKTLGLVRHESGFNPDSNNGTTFGYMQIHKMRHEKLSKQLKTANAPLNPYINLNWGTKMLEDLYRTFEKEGYKGDKLDRAVWSAYNKGEYGFRNTGEATAFINRNYKHIKWVENKLGI